MSKFKALVTIISRTAPQSPPIVLEDANIEVLYKGTEFASDIKSINVQPSGCKCPNCGEAL